MKLLVISAAFPPSQAGEADHALHLCERLADRGLDVQVLTTKRDLEATHFPFQVYSIMRGWSWRDLPRFAWFLRCCAPDAVLLIYSDRDYDCHSMITLAPSIAKAILPSAPFVTQFETEYVARKASLLTRAAFWAVARLRGAEKFDRVYGTLLFKSDWIITLSERHRAILSTQNAQVEKRGLVIPPPPLLRRRVYENGNVSRKHDREILGVQADGFLLAYFGYVYAEKGIETLLQALEILTRRKPDTRLVMIGGTDPASNGSSYLKGINSLIKQLKIEDRVIWTGRYTSNSDEASRYLSAADAGVFPFKYGVTLNRSSVAAAASHGLPIVTTRGESLERAFREQENVLLCAPEDPNALASAIASVIDNPVLRQRLQRGALELAEEYFCWNKALDHTVQALSS
jgi:polysaccharide biosynthesis protein PslF